MILTNTVGWLEIQEELLLNVKWNRYWFQLTVNDYSLLWFRKEHQMYNPTGSIDIGGVSKITTSEDIEKKHLIILYSTQRQYKLRVETIEDRNRWIKALYLLQKLITQNRNEKNLTNMLKIDGPIKSLDEKSDKIESNNQENSILSPRLQIKENPQPPPSPQIQNIQIKEKESLPQPPQPPQPTVHKEKILPPPPTPPTTQKEKDPLPQPPQPPQQSQISMPVPPLQRANTVDSLPIKSNPPLPFPKKNNSTTTQFIPPLSTNPTKAKNQPKLVEHQPIPLKTPQPTKSAPTLNTNNQPSIISPNNTNTSVNLNNIKDLLINGSLVQIAQSYDSISQSFKPEYLFHVLERSHHKFEVLRLLCSDGPLLEYKDSNQRTVIMHALQNFCDSKTIKWMILLSPCLELDSQKRTLLHYLCSPQLSPSVSDERETLCNLLLSKGIDLDEMDVDGNSIIYLAVANYLDKIVAQLVDKVDISKKTAMLCSSRPNNSQLIQMMLPYVSPVIKKTIFGVDN